MSWVALENLILLVSGLFHPFRKPCIGIPERGAGIMNHSLVDFPAWWADKAASARASNLPDSASSSICRSHALASNFSYHARNVFRSLGGKAAIALSISSTLMLTSQILLTLSIFQCFHVLPPMVNQTKKQDNCTNKGNSIVLPISCARLLMTSQGGATCRHSTIRANIPKCRNF